VHYHLILTDNCNLSCSYCRGRIFETPVNQSTGLYNPLVDGRLPVDLDFDLDDLYAFLKKDPDPVLTFYGGEPLLRADLVTQIVREATGVRFILQTNGILLHLLSPDVTRRLSTLLVSIDGPQELTDRYRGTGVYRRVMANVHALRKEGYAGEVIARMTAGNNTDIRSAVTYLAANTDHAFSSIHWQLDADFGGTERGRTFGAWAEGSYNPGIRALVRVWVDHMRNGVVERWYPFLDTMQDLISGNRSKLRCGSGYSNYAIMTDGNIAPCPVMVGMKEFYCGHITGSIPGELKTIPITGSCTTCAIFDFCGGRCLYANILHPWSEEQRNTVCGTVVTLHEALQDVLPEVLDLLRKGVIRPTDFDHEKFNGCEIIP